MSETGQPLTEHVELTYSIFKVLMNYTASDPDLQTEKLRHFVQALHKGSWIATKWAVELTAADIETVDYILQCHFLRTPQHRLRFTNHMRGQSKMFCRIYNERKAEA